MKDDNERKPEEHGQAKEYTIVVNGRQKTVTSQELTFAQVIALAFDKPPSGQSVVFTVTYRRGHGEKPEGSMIEGDTVKVKEGMIFNVTATDKS